MPPAEERLSALSEQLVLIAEQLSDLAIDRLREAVELADDEAAALARLERRITRARRSIEKAAVLLSEPPAPEGDGI